MMNTDNKQTLSNYPTLKTTKQDEAAARNRRHWYDHEKLSIIKDYDAQKLYTFPGEPDSVTDPKSKGPLAVKLIEEWRTSFIKLGILKRSVPKTVEIKTFKKQPFSSEETTAKDIILDLVKENQILRQRIAELDKKLSK